MEKIFKELVQICCICGHRLDEHIEEEKWWRCHSLSLDYYQCECRLLKALCKSKEEYNYIKRKFECIDELNIELDSELFPTLFLNKNEEFYYFYLHYLEQTPKVLSGKLRIAGTRISIKLILEMVAAGIDLDTILEEYPHLERAIVKKVIEFRDKLEELI